MYRYGLLLPKKQPQKTTPKLGNVFGDNDTSDEDDGTDWVKKALRAESEKNKMKKQTKLDIQKALNEDPTIYQYDEVYDDMERTKSQSEINKQKEKKPRYIQNLLKTAERRKKEQEHRIGRMIQKERELEGDMYADKESFVTSAYRAKLEEFKKMEEEEARMSRLEAIGDVTKQQDMSGFYRHLYEQTVEYKGETNNDESSNTTEKNTTQEKEQIVTSNEQDEKDTTAAPEETSKATIKPKKSRQYRKRAVETYESDSEMEKNTEELKEDVTVTSSTNETGDKSEIQEPEKKQQELVKTDANTENNTDIKNKDINTKDIKISSDTKEVALEEIENKKIKETKDRCSILEKRTIGPVFEAALQRYYARKAKRIAMV